MAAQAVGAQVAPTACCTSVTNRRVDAARSNSAARARPAAARTSCRVGSRSTRPTAAANGTADLSSQHQPGAADRLGHRGDAVGDDRDAVAHRLGQRHAEALVVRGHHEDVGGVEVRLELAPR